MSIVPHDFEESYDRLVQESHPGVNYLLEKFNKPIVNGGKTTFFVTEAKEAASTHLVK